MSVGPDVASRELVSVDPATLETLGYVAVTPPEELAEVVTEARLAQVGFAREPFEARSRLLARVVHVLVDAADEIASTISSESGKPLAEAYAHELVVSADACRWHADNLGRVLREERLGFPQLVLRQKRGAIRYEPLGVVGIVTPWNFPLAIPVRQAAAAVAAGNAAVVKPSELTPLSGAWVEEIFRRAGAPAGLVRVVQGGGDVGEALVRHRGVAAVVFTGSAEVGRKVAQAAAERLCPAVLELGGKDAMLVLDDADLDRAVDGALWGVFTNCGQACAGVERIAVPSGLHDAFVERLVARSGELHIGRGTDPGVDLGPLVSEAQRGRFESLVADAVEHGAAVATGGRRPELELPGWFYEPTLLLGEPRTARIVREELFGPAAVIVSMDNEEEMVRWVNDSPFGLGASVWTRDAGRGRALAAMLETGAVWHNDHAYSFGASQAPWGGRRLLGARPDGLTSRPLRALAREVGRRRPRPADAGLVVPVRRRRGRRPPRAPRRALRGRAGGSGQGGRRPPARARPPREEDASVSELSHVDESTGEVRMVDVGAKPASRRRAVARGRVLMDPSTASRLRSLPKGDALTVARIAGIQAAKRTGELIPLCHPLPLTVVEVDLTIDGDGVAIEAAVETVAQTGVEMEALTAVAVAALTVYDMAKAVDKAMRIEGIELVSKTKEPV